MKKIVLCLLIFTSRAAIGQNVDIELLNDFNPAKEQRNTDNFFKATSFSAYPVSIATPLTVLSVGLIKKDKMLRAKSYQMMAGIVFSMGTSVALKRIIDRERPYQTYPFIINKVKTHSSSFPSGHTIAVFETATSLSLNFPKWYVIVPAYTWAGLVSYSRMYLGVHYPSDVGAGILLGAGSAWLTWKINQKLQRRKTVEAPKK